MSSTALYTDLSRYYDLMCADIPYPEQSAYVHRLNRLLGNHGNDYLDLACGTGLHIQHFLDLGYSATGIDIHQPMLDRAAARCPGAHFLRQDMADLAMEAEMDLISCFLYSIHYNPTLAALERCIQGAQRALRPGGLLCFNAVDKCTIDNRAGIKHRLVQDGSAFCFESSWYYAGAGDQQELRLHIEKIEKIEETEKTTGGITQVWHERHAMVAATFVQIKALLEPYFEVHLFAHDYSKITAWVPGMGNAFFVGVKR